MASLTNASSLRATQIIDIKPESPTTKTYVFRDELCSEALPGQFVMLWIPRVDEIPLSIMGVSGDAVSVAVKGVGEGSSRLHGFRVGDTIGVRGPFGSHFSDSEGKVLLVGGGTGTAPLLFLARRLSGKCRQLVFATGAKTGNELLFLDEIKQLCPDDDTISTTEDGTLGQKGLVTAPVENRVRVENFDMVYTCGPERMMRKVFDMAEKYSLPVEASLERIMRCGIGLCGSCAIGGYLTCKDGPVFGSKELREIKTEFGVSKLGFDGSKIPI